MEIEFDPDKDAINIAKHGLSLALATEFDLLASAVSIDRRYDYGEVRFRAFGRMNGVGFCLAFTRRGTVVRPISFRQAREKEMRRYE